MSWRIKYRLPNPLAICLTALLFMTSNLGFISSAKADNNEGKAFDSLSACINREATKFVNILFLVDSSASLRKEDGGADGTGSDPNDLRAGMVKSAITTLKDLNDPNSRKVSFAVTTFDRESPGRDQKGKPLPNFDWTEATPENVERAAEWTEKIKEFDYGQATDWVKGLSNAKRELLERAPGDTQDRCHAIIWFTDGALDVEAGDEEKGAIEALCGTVPGQAGIPKDSVMAEIRRSNIHLIGLLLSPKNPNESTKRLISLLYPAVLGQPNPDAPASTKDFNCGGPIPDSQGQGYYIEVKNTEQLAKKFVDMINRIVIGPSIPTICQNGDTSFVLDKGLERLVIFIPSKNWQVQLPNGEGVTPTSALPKGASRILVQEKFYQVNFDASLPNLLGTWSINSDDCPSVFLNSGLLPRLSSANSSLVVGKENQLVKGGVFKKSGEKPDLSVYQSVTLEVEILDSTEQGRQSRVSRASIDAGTAGWQANVSPYEGGSTSNMVLKLRITTSSGVALPEVRVSTFLSLRYPEDFCSVYSEKLTLSPLVPVKKPATGSIKFIGPTSQNSTCQVTFKDFRITSDPKNRSASDFNIQLNASISTDLLSGAALSINSGEVRNLEFSIGDDVITGGTSRGTLIFSVKSLTSSEEIDQSIVFDFENSPQGPTFWEVFLISLLGIGLSLSLLYLANFLYGKLRLRDLRIAHIPVLVSITDSKIEISRNDSDTSFMEDRHFHWLDLEDESRSFSIEYAGVNILTSSLKLPKNPFGEIVGIGSVLDSRRGIGSEDSILDPTGKAVLVPLNPNGTWFATVQPDALLEVGKTTQFKALISILLVVEEGPYKKVQFKEVENSIRSSKDRWIHLATLLKTPSSESGGPNGPSSGPDGNNQSPGSNPGGPGKGPEAGGIEGNAEVREDRNPWETSQSAEGMQSKERRGFFGKGRSKSSKKDTDSNSGAGEIQESDDPWAT